jgi:hypothetical protein
MKFRLLSAFVGVVLALGTGGPGAAAPGNCESGRGSGKPVEVSEPLPEAERVSLSKLVYEALRTPPQGHRPESLIDDAPPCPLGNFQAGDVTLSLSAGVAPFPTRWAVSADRNGTFYLVAGPSGDDARRFGIKAAPHLLVGVYDRIRVVLSVFDNAPSDATLKAAIANSMSDPEFTPLAQFDTEGDAVTLFRETQSGIGAQLFGAPPSGERTAAIGLPDGRYFVPGPSGRAVMREPDLPCPFELGKLTTRQLIVVEGSEEKLDLACQYRDDDAFSSGFRAPTSSANSRPGRPA